MKYQQLTHLETGWKWKYLVKKHHEGEVITRYLQNSEAEQAVAILLQLENHPHEIENWITQHVNPQLLSRMSQTIRARRKRYFNAEHQQTKKKSIDLEYSVWARLAHLAKQQQKTLSEMIVQLIDDAESKLLYQQRISSVKQDLLAILTDKPSAPPKKKP